MKKISILAGLILAISLMTIGRASAITIVLPANEGVGGVIGTGLLGENPFSAFGKGYRALFPGLYAPNGLMSMAAGSMGTFGESMGVGLRLGLGSASLLQKEFAALDRRMAVDLGAQAASGTHQGWTPLSIQESMTLETVPSLAGMTGF